ncbi:hypothetical protein BX600DRAFT_502651 [Xylariales sp. PMI_506]|nr:hypothetical protein BX600DRAFT_502651 [Xylariales sp. PMI_506]
MFLKTPTRKTSRIDYAPIPHDIIYHGTERASQETGMDEAVPSYHRYALPWCLTAILGCINLVLTIWLYTLSQTHGERVAHSYANGFRTEFAAARQHVELVETVFNGGPSFREDGSVYIPHPDRVRYIGDPRRYPEVDSNWEKLIEGRYFRITEVEAQESFGDSYKDYWDAEAGGYVIGLDLFHTLHCVNHLRRAYYPEIYKGDSRNKPPETIEIHRNHCLEQIRQYIMCHADLTAIPTKYYKEVDRNYVVSDMPHTCRNFEKIQNWMLDRHGGQSMVHSIFWNETRGGDLTS